MFNNRKERAELLEGLVVTNKDVAIPKFPQVLLGNFIELISQAQKVFK